MMKIELPQSPDIDRSAIEWCGPTWNPWQGCIKVSAGCKNCYMYRDKKRYGKDPSKVVRSAKATFDKPLKWQREVERGIRNGNDRLVFTCSWSDWFIDEADEWRDEAWAIIRRCPGLIFQILTKRAGRIANHLPDFWDEIKERCWLGVSCEDQATADERIPHLLKSPAAVRFLSVEPLLGAIDLEHIGPENWDVARGWKGNANNERGWANTSRIDWIIVGGESGSGARMCDVQWIRSIVALCKEAELPVFVKQLGRKPIGMGTGADLDRWAKFDHPNDKGGEPEAWPLDLRVRQFPSNIPT